MLGGFAVGEVLARRDRGGTDAEFSQVTLEERLAVAAVGGDRAWHAAKTMAMARTRRRLASATAFGMTGGSTAGAFGAWSGDLLTQPTVASGR